MQFSIALVLSKLLLFATAPQLAIEMEFAGCAAVGCPYHP